MARTRKAKKLLFADLEGQYPTLAQLAEGDFENAIELIEALGEIRNLRARRERDQQRIQGEEPVVWRELMVAQLSCRSAATPERMMSVADEILVGYIARYTGE